MNDNKFLIKSEKVGELSGEVQKKDSEWVIKNKKGDLEGLKFVTKVSELVFNKLNKGGGVELNINSKIPPSSGLGSSSAVTTSTAGAVSSLLKAKLEKKEIIKLAYQAEKEIQGEASRAGVSVATTGGFLKVQQDKFEKIEDLKKLKLVIGYTEKCGDTGKLVKKVKKLKNSRPEIYDPMIKTIGKTTEKGIENLKKGDLEKVGALMNANQALLEGLDVSSPEIRNLVDASLDAGAIGAKITGAGGGGCILALGIDNIEEIEKAIIEENGRPIKVEIGLRGLEY